MWHCVQNPSKHFLILLLSLYQLQYDDLILKGEYLTIEKLKMILIGLNKDYIFVSNDSFPFEVEKYDPDILKIVLKYQNKETINPHLVNPCYLKLTEAEENRLKDND